MKRHTHVSIMGTIGSGKTTVARLLASELKFQLLEEHFGENAFLPRLTWQLLEAGRVLSDARDPLWKKGYRGIVQDVPIQQDVFSYAKAQHVLGNMDDAEWRLYQKIYRSFEPQLPVPDLVIYLETSVSELTRRIGSRGRGYEQKIPANYLELLDMLNHKWLSENKTIPVLTIETDGLNIVRSKKAQEELLQKVRKTLT
ncbi:MAG: Deoxynucleoside kinase [Parcubacteria group bacterium GW2011_GWA1_49_11]|nr:MAG: Deoxynucleoside kinase [Parcubacteria group bacterium GW2011_GWA1_49_11]